MIKGFMIIVALGLTQNANNIEILRKNYTYQESETEPPTSEVVFQEQVFTLTKDNGKMVLTLISATECKIEYFTGETLYNSITATYTLENNVITIGSGENAIKANLNVDGTFTEYVEKEPEWYEQYLVDADGNGTPDFIDNWEKTELIGGITIGAVVSTCISVLGIIMSAIYYGKKLKMAQGISDNSNSQLASSKEQMVSLIKENAELKASLEHLTNALSENNNYLKQVEITNKKVDILLENQVTIACNDDKMVSNGIAKTIQTNTSNATSKE